MEQRIAQETAIALQSHISLVLFQDDASVPDSPVASEIRFNISMPTTTK
jgi:hypothetical protein